MPIKTRTDAEMVEILATKGMGFKWHPATESQEEYLEQPDGPNVRVRLCVYRVHLLRDLGYLFTDLNAVRKIEERLTEEQLEEYIRISLRDCPELPAAYRWDNRHIKVFLLLSAHVKARALSEVLEGNGGDDSK